MLLCVSHFSDVCLISWPTATSERKTIGANLPMFLVLYFSGFSAAESSSDLFLSCRWHLSSFMELCER